LNRLGKLQPFDLDRPCAHPADVKELAAAAVTLILPLTMVCSFFPS
jgi:hypothetical protein